MLVNAIGSDTVCWCLILHVLFTVARPPRKKLSFNVKSLLNYASTVQYHVGSLVDLYEQLSDKPVDYDGE